MTKAVEEIYICDCNETEHHVVVKRWGDEPYVYFAVSMIDKLPFWRRVRIALSYILGRRGKYDFHYCETLLNVEKAERLKRILDRFIKDQENEEDYAE